jgi:hypothetical protein
LLDTAQPRATVSLAQTADLPEVRDATLFVLIAGIYAVLTRPPQCSQSPGTLRNISPLPQQSPLQSGNLDKDVVLPILTPMISTLSLSQCSMAVQTIIQQEVSFIYL